MCIWSRSATSWLWFLSVLISFERTTEPLLYYNLRFQVIGHDMQKSREKNPTAYEQYHLIFQIPWCICYGLVTDILWRFHCQRKHEDVQIYGWREWRWLSSRYEGKGVAKSLQRIDQIKAIQAPTSSVVAVKAAELCLSSTSDGPQRHICIFPINHEGHNIVSITFFLLKQIQVPSLSGGHS